MQLIQLAAAVASGFVAVASAAPARNVQSIPSDYTWSVSGWNAGCTATGCSYTYQVSGQLEGIFPAFVASCTGNDNTYFSACSIISGATTSGKPSVAGALKHYNYLTDNAVAAMSVSLKFTDADTSITYNYTGYANASFDRYLTPNYDFTVKPTLATAVL